MIDNRHRTAALLMYSFAALHFGLERGDRADPFDDTWYEYCAEGMSSARDRFESVVWWSMRNLPGKITMVRVEDWLEYVSYINSYWKWP